VEDVKIDRSQRAVRHKHRERRCRHQEDAARSFALKKLSQR